MHSSTANLTYFRFVFEVLLDTHDEALAEDATQWDVITLVAPENLLKIPTKKLSWQEIPTEIVWGRHKCGYPLEELPGSVVEGFLRFQEERSTQHEFVRIELLPKFLNHNNVMLQTRLTAKTS